MKFIVFKPDYDMRLGRFQSCDVKLHWVTATEEAFHFQILHELAQSDELIFCLKKRV